MPPALSPLLIGDATMMAPLPATGRGWAHSPSHVAAAGAWKESGWLKIQEARLCPFPPKPQQWGGSGDRRKAHGDGVRPLASALDAELRRHREGSDPEPQMHSGTQIAATRAPRGGPGDPEGPGEPWCQAQRV